MTLDTATHNAAVRRQWFGGLVLIIVGSVLLADKMDLVDFSFNWRFWPAIIALFGLSRIVGSAKLADALSGVFLIFFSIWLYACVEHLWGWSFRTSWPILLIGVGLAHILESLAQLAQRGSTNGNGNNNSNERSST